MSDVFAIHITIHRTPGDVQAFASNGANLPRWASGLGGTVRPDQGAWIANGPLGEIRVRFTAPGSLGVLDHEVTLPSGEIVHNTMRVAPAHDGSVVTFTLRRLPGVTDAQLQTDAATVQHDLATLKSLLEAPVSARTRR